MANQKLFIEGETIGERVGNSMSTTYDYDGDELIIMWRGREFFWRTGVKPGDAFVVCCDGSEPKVKKLKVPHRNNDLLMWLLSFSKENRVSSEEEFALLLKWQRKENAWYGYRDWGIEGEGYAFTLCNRPDCGGVQHIAAFVEKKVDKALVKEVFQRWERGIYWPRTFVESLLKKRFGFTDADLAELNEVNWWHK